MMGPIALRDGITSARDGTYVVMAGGIISRPFDNAFEAAIECTLWATGAYPNVPDHYKPHIYRLLDDACPDGCCCGGQIHPQSVQVE